MRGLPFSATVEDVTSFFTGCQIAEGGVRLCSTNGRRTGEVCASALAPSTGAFVYPLRPCPCQALALALA